MLQLNPQLVMQVASGSLCPGYQILCPVEKYRGRGDAERTGLIAWAAGRARIASHRGAVDHSGDLCPLASNQAGLVLLRKPNSIILQFYARSFLSTPVLAAFIVFILAAMNKGLTTS
ncbi:MAG: hypothetical protein VYA55_17450 [Pseudomonadota bacterium]|nr:hypothetical protein [Pseudomonadota bacterium]